MLDEVICELGRPRLASGISPGFNFYEFANEHSFEVDGVTRVKNSIYFIVVR